MNEPHGTLPDLDLAGARCLVVGLAREGTALARYLAEHGAAVTVTDARPADALEHTQAALAGLPLAFALGGHPLSLLDEAQILFVSPGVPLEIPLLAEARRRGLPLSSETRLFTRLCPAPIVGITGSSGKTTTTVLTGRMLEGTRRIWVGGNIGQPLIGSLAGEPAIGPQDTVVMELSSFQLEFFAPWPPPAAAFARQAIDSGGPAAIFDPSGWSPPVAALLNITPNHLDRHGTMEAYIAAKEHIVAHQQPDGLAVLNQDDATTRRLGLAARQRVLWFSLQEPVAEGAWLRGKELVLRLGGHEEVVCRTGEMRLRGQHNVANVLAASALAGTAGAPLEALRREAITFAGVEHRLELVRTRAGVGWYNDSIATSPERAVAALRSFKEPIVLLAGGRDKHLPWEEMAALVWRRVRHLVLFGEAAGLIEAAMERARPAGQGVALAGVHHGGNLERAVEIAAGLARPGDVVLLSPGGTSFDAYADFLARGEHFRQLVRALE
ncbi:MAG: UDP-N-acetylmuramoyl-L-alanine--D-glutamate ligase [Anaerolineae bacterium]|jgi:UDP-N-acetylmuramoylalanine--D-glutamate ligase|nr:UDP-N-acetylmuramoyl-L-alanine--D-glutamate ligase [Anaerolineae bacterium]MDX9832299.1 UDP-N-acetylmuramoyl-L-alanine--D-glutamate ligase [Anaerolineae bacterium]